MKWFMHQSQAHRDAKLKKVLMKYGAEGYGLYWYCLEQICADVDPKLTFELEDDSEILAHDLKIDTLKVEEMMLYMVNIGLFEASENVISCMKLARYLGDKNTRNTELVTIIKGQKALLSATVPDRPRQSALEERRGDKNIKDMSDKSDECREVFDYWVQKTGHTRAKFTSGRKSKITSRLKEGYSVNDLKQAINGNRASGYHRGKNDSKTVYDSIDLIFRNGEKVEQFMGMAEKNKNTAQEFYV